MFDRLHCLVFRFGGAVAFVVAALLLTLTVRALFDLPNCYFFFAVAVVLAAWLGGVWAGVLATVAAMLAINYFFIEPLHTLDIDDPNDCYFFALLLIEGIFLSALTSMLNSPDHEIMPGTVPAYLVAAAVTSAAVLARLIALLGSPQTAFTPAMPFALFPIAVLLSAWTGGLGPGLFTAVSATFAAGYLFMKAETPAQTWSADRVVPPLLFLVEGGVIAVLGATIHSVRSRAASSAREARRLHQAFLQSEERYRLLVEGRDHALFLLDPEGRVLTWDAGAQRVLGHAAKEIVGSHFRVFSPAEDQQVKRPEEDLRAAAAHGRHESLGWRVRRGGEPFWAEVHLCAAISAGPHGFAVIVRDVSERRQLEEQVQQAQKMEAVGRLASGVAHDFNNLLGAVLGYSQLVLAKMAPDDPLRGDLLEIIGVGERTAQLTRQLLTLGRTRAGQPQVIDLGAVVRNLCKVLQRIIGEDIDLVVSPASALAPVKAEPSQLEQVVLNLIVNARDAMPTGGKLTVETRNIDLDDAYARAHPGVRPGPHVLLSVSDTGIGMNAEVKSRIFEPFFTTKQEGQGTGLGLATVYGIIQQSGGHIAVDSEPGCGASFRVYLPAAAPIPTGRTDDPEESAPRGTETVLLVEDEDYLRRLFRAMLQTVGYQVIEACGGSEALQFSQRHTGTIHLLVTDVVMPRLSGRDLAEALTGQRPGLKVLYISGYPEDAIRGRGLLGSGLPFLQKPFTPDALARKVREVLDG